MPEIFSIVIILFIFLLLIFIFKKRIKSDLEKKVDITFKDPIDLYGKTSGYAYDDLVKITLNKTLKDKPKNLEEKIINDFITADLIRYNILPNINEQNEELVRLNSLHHYNRALNEIYNHPGVELAIPQEFIVDRIEGFYQDLDRPLNFNEVKNKIRETKAVKPVEVKKKDFIDNFYAEKKIVNDGQNVHNSNVNNDVKRIYNILLEKNSNIPDKSKTIIFEEIDTALRKHYVNDDKKESALIVLNEFKKGGHNSNLNTNADDILINVWKRIHSPENENKKDELQAAFFDSIADSMENNHYGTQKNMVCLVGRCNRILQTFTLLDNDANLSKPIKTKEILKNEIFSKSYKIIQDELKKLPEATANVYNGISNSDDQEIQRQIGEFESKLKIEIENISKEYPDTDPKILEPIINDAKSGI